MAPVVPSKRRSLRAKLAAKSEGAPYAPRKAPRPDAVEASDEFLNSKRDKRLVKHSSFVSRIEKSNKKPLKRRRPGKKLVTDLDSLKKALPDLLADGETEESLQQLKDGKVRLTSLKSSRGVLKKKERVVKREVERFQGNLARLNAVTAQNTGDAMDAVESQGNNAGQPAQSQATQSATADRWAALRGFISATMEQNPAFVGKKQVEK